MNYARQLELGCQHLSQQDPRFKPLIEKYGLPTIKPHTDYYQTLVESIISQQLSVKAAATITSQFIDLYHHFPTPSEILTTDFETLRSVGLSGQKANYIRDLALHVENHSINFERLDSLDDQQIIDELTAVKGIGEWTVHMFLMFCMGRLDVLATGDLGIRNAVTKLYDFNETATPTDVADIAQQYSWAPYRTVACWYLWRSLDNKPSIS